MGRSREKFILEELILTAKRLGSYPPKTLTAASVTTSGLMCGIIVFMRVIGETSNPAKTNEAGASRVSYQHYRKWPVLGSQPPPRTAIYGNDDITL